MATRRTSDAASPSFELFEALLWEPGVGYFLLGRHLERMARSAAHFGFSLDVEGLRRALDEHAAALVAEPRKVRVELSRDGGIAVRDEAVKPSTTVRAAVARIAVDSSDVFLRHKTSRRDVYDAARAEHPAAGDVILWNERGELTETCSANLVLEIDRRRLTPTLSSGLLPGTFRAHLLAAGEIEEAVLPVSDLGRASKVWLVNSVRRWCAIDLA